MRKVIIMLLCLITMYSFKNDVITGKASYYGENHHGRKTASGEIFNMYKYTAAHKYLKFGTIIKVTSLETDKSVIVRINDRGPYIKGRDLDLSKTAFFKIAPSRLSGTMKVKIEIIHLSMMLMLSLQEQNLLSLMCIFILNYMLE